MYCTWKREHAVYVKCCICRNTKDSFIYYQKKLNKSVNKLCVHAFLLESVVTHKTYKMQSTDFFLLSRALSVNLLSSRLGMGSALFNSKHLTGLEIKSYWTNMEKTLGFFLILYHHHHATYSRLESPSNFL